MTSPITKDGEYTTRSGLPVRIYATDAGVKQPVQGAYNRNGEWFISEWDADGRYMHYPSAQHPLDLIPKPKVRKIEFWMNIYPDGEMGWRESSRELADKNAAPTRVACIHIQREFVEGEGLE